MSVQLNHIIVYARDSQASALYLSDDPRLARAHPLRTVPHGRDRQRHHPRLPGREGDISPQHYAFLVSEAEFDEIFGRIRKLELPYWADPGRRRPGEINHGDGGRGVYFEDPAATSSKFSPAPTAAAVELEKRLKNPRRATASC